MRIFAGPNGSGKSMVISAVREKLIEGYPIDFGIYINADDIARTLSKSSLHFKDYSLLNIKEEDIVQVALESGLINNFFTKDQFLSAFKVNRNRLQLLDKSHAIRFAQVIADFLRKRLLNEDKKFSFETVFSHPGKLDIMKEATRKGYKVYLYYVSTMSPEINKNRVKIRVSKGGHDVPDDKIESRYYKSLDLQYDAAQIAYQAYFFDNSKDNGEIKMFAHFKKREGKKVWDNIIEEDVPDWFVQYYQNKIEK